MDLGNAEPYIGPVELRAVLIEAAMIQHNSWFSAITAIILSREKRPFATICSSQDFVSFSSFRTIRSL